MSVFEASHAHGSQHSDLADGDRGHSTCSAIRRLPSVIYGPHAFSASATSCANVTSGLRSLFIELLIT